MNTLLIICALIILPAQGASVNDFGSADEGGENIFPTNIFPTIKCFLQLHKTICALEDKLVVLVIDRLDSGFESGSGLIAYKNYFAFSWEKLCTEGKQSVFEFHTFLQGGDSGNDSGYCKDCLISFQDEGVRERALADHDNDTKCCKACAIREQGVSLQERLSKHITDLTKATLPDLLNPSCIKLNKIRAEYCSYAERKQMFLNGCMQDLHEDFADVEKMGWKDPEIST